MRPLVVFSLLVAARALAQDGGAAVGTTMPQLVRAAEPLYPREALSLRAKATVVLELDLDEHGRVEASRLVKEEAVRKDLGFVEAAVAASSSLEFTPALVDGVPTPATVEFTFTFAPPALGKLTGVVRSTAGAPLAQAKVQAWATIEGHRVGARAAADGSGRFEFDTLPPGQWTVEAAAPGFVRAQQAVGLDADATAALTLVLHPAEKTKS